jgi:Protein of unknown function (DUF3035)
MTSKFMARTAVFAALALAGLSTAGCQNASKALGMEKVTPDEFRVVSKAPLVVPPDYSLRPPAPGEPRPQELQPESAARAALTGQAAAAGRSVGENLLVAKAGGDKSDPLIRFVVDDETGDLAHKDKSFADTVMFWRKGSGASAAAQAGSEAAVQPAPLDAAKASEDAKALTGDKAIVIARKSQTKFKLPGL